MLALVKPFQARSVHGVAALVDITRGGGNESAPAFVLVPTAAWRSDPVQQ